MQRERLTITLDKELLAALDTLIDRRILRNRSQTIEHLLREGLALHEFQQAFLFFEEVWSQETLINTLALADGIGIGQILLGVPASSPALASEVNLAVDSYRQAHPGAGFSTETVPSDFGSGGTVLMRQTLLRYPFLITWIGAAPLPLASLASIYTFHRQHHQPLTLAAAPGTPLEAMPLAIASPEIADSIPTGIVSLRKTVFPDLVKAGKVREYPIL